MAKGRKGGAAYPPRNAPTGLRAGIAVAATASDLRAEVWKAREVYEESVVVGRAKARNEGARMRDDMFGM